MRHANNFIKRLLGYESSINTLTLSFCMGNYIAFSPYIGLHTIMIFVFTWFFRLNLAVTFAVAYLINNPFTMVPVYLSDYLVGYWLLYSFLGLDMQAINPLWLTKLNLWLQSAVGFNMPCLWAFLIGGNLLGIVSSVILYPIMKYIFKLFRRSQSHENSSAE